MSFPEGPIEGERSYDDSGDSAPTGGPLSTVLRAIRTHGDSWAGRYVEMRVEARGGGR